MSRSAKVMLCLLLATMLLVGCHSPKRKSNGPELVVDGVVLRYNGHDLHLGDPVSSWIGALGPPSRASAENMLWTWDDLGMLVRGDKMGLETVVDEFDLSLAALDDPSMSDGDRLVAIESERELLEAIKHDLYDVMSSEQPSSGALVAKYKDAYFDRWQHPRHAFPGRVTLEHAELEKGWNDLADTVRHMHGVPDGYWYCRRRPLVDIVINHLIPHGSGQIYEKQEPDVVFDSPAGRLKIQFGYNQAPDGGECDWRFRELRFRRW